MLARDGFRFRRSGDVILVPQADIWPNRASSRIPLRARFKDLLNFQINTDRHRAENIARGDLSTGWDPHGPSRIIPVPGSLLRYLQGLEAELGPFPPVAGDLATSRT